MVPATQIHSVERATLPVLPAVELVGVSSERVDTGPLIRHELSCEITVGHTSEDGADTALDAIVGAVRRRLGAAERAVDPIDLPTREGLAVVLGDTRWSTSAQDAARTVRGASVSVSVEVSD